MSQQSHSADSGIGWGEVNLLPLKRATPSLKNAPSVEDSTLLARLPAWVEQAFWCFLVAVGFGALQSYSGLSRVAWLIADLFVVGCFVQAFSQYLSVSARAWLFYSWPALAITSCLWSLVPSLSIYHGLQLTATVMVGVVLFTRWGFLGTIRIVFLGLLSAVCLSFIDGQRDQFGNLIGVFGHKNQLGGAGVALFFTSIVLFMPRWRLVSLLGTIVAVVAVVFSHSGTALLSLALAACTLAMAVIWIMSRSVFLIAIAVAAVLISSIVYALSIQNLSIVDEALRLLGKDATLTGRTVLWRYGWLSFMDHFWLGVGYKAYMASPLTTSTLIQYILQQRLPYLHNNWLDVAVDLGIVGLGMFGVVVCLTIIRIINVFIRYRTILYAWSLCFLANTLIASLAEGSLFYNHSMTQVLIVVVYLNAVVSTVRTRG
ncbi:O-antigen ligase family protein [Microvirga terrae]|uniref:O-antigen ligase family protein n=1 Tax=Microvirga terrae TaxID=2740529 RepID=A0ABY5RNP1_9HYPH|nr:O-antigen ligase family protein [Microvirga terrae]UVF18407.1 O-antigen ligase family protein [Microvirga terrae]